MHGMRLGIVAVAFISLFVLSFSIRGEDQKSPNLRVWLEMSKSDYKLCETVWAYLFAVSEGTNSADIPVVEVEDLFALRLDIRNENGKVLTYGGLTGVSSEEHASLSPGDTIAFPICVSDGHSKSWSRKYFHSIPPGSYTVNATYLGKFQTNTVAFNVSPLSPQEDSVAQGYFAIIESGKHGRARLEAYLGFYDRNQHSVIGADVGRFLLTKLASQKDKQVQCLEHAKKMVDLYPQHGVCEEALRLLIRRLPEQQMRAFLESRSAVLQQPYTRFMFRLAAQRCNKAYLIKEVEQ